MLKKYTAYSITFAIISLIVALSFQHYEFYRLSEYFQGAQDPQDEYDVSIVLEIRPQIQHLLKQPGLRGSNDFHALGDYYRHLVRLKNHKSPKVQEIILNDLPLIKELANDLYQKIATEKMYAMNYSKNSTELMQKHIEQVLSTLSQKENKQNGINIFEWKDTKLKKGDCFATYYQKDFIEPHQKMYYLKVYHVLAVGKNEYLTKPLFDTSEYAFKNQQYQLELLSKNKTMSKSFYNRESNQIGCEIAFKLGESFLDFQQKIKTYSEYNIALEEVVKKFEGIILSDASII